MKRDVHAVRTTGPKTLPARLKLTPRIFQYPNLAGILLRFSDGSLDIVSWTQYSVLKISSDYTCTCALTPPRQDTLCVVRQEVTCRNNQQEPPIYSRFVLVQITQKVSVVHKMKCQQLCYTVNETWTAVEGCRCKKFTMEEHADTLEYYNNYVVIFNTSEAILIYYLCNSKLFQVH